MRLRRRFQQHAPLEPSSDGLVRDLTDYDRVRAGRGGCLMATTTPESLKWLLNFGEGGNEFRGELVWTYVNIWGVWPADAPLNQEDRAAFRRRFPTVRSWIEVVRKPRPQR